MGIAQEISHRRAGGLAQQLGRRAGLQQPAVAQQHHVVGQVQGLVDVMCDQHHRLARVVLNAQQCGLQRAAGQWVERAKGLVHQQDFRPRGQRPRHPHTLLLATRQLVRVALAVNRWRQAQQRQQLVHA